MVKEPLVFVSPVPVYSGSEDVLKKCNVATTTTTFGAMGWRLVDSTLHFALTLWNQFTPDALWRFATQHDGRRN